MRSSLEPIFSRFAQGHRLARHYIRGHAKMKARATLAAAVIMAMALGHVTQWTATADTFIGQAGCSARYRLTSHHQITTIEAISHAELRTALV